MSGDPVERMAHDLVDRALHKQLATNPRAMRLFMLDAYARVSINLARKTLEAAVESLYQQGAPLLTVEFMVDDTLRRVLALDAAEEAAAHLTGAWWGT